MSGKLRKRRLAAIPDGVLGRRGFAKRLALVRAAEVRRTARVTARKTLATVIATRCIESGYPLLHSDRDFEPFVRHLGLRVVE